MKDDCIQAIAQAAGRTLTQAETKDIENRITSAMRLIAQKDPEGFRAMDQETRLREAGKLAAEQLQAEAAKKKQRVALTIQAHDRVDNYLKEMKTKFPEMNGLEALRRKLAFHSDFKNVDTSIEYKAKAIETNEIRQMNSVLESISPDFFGMIQNKEGIKGFVYELFGQDSSFLDPRSSKILKQAAEEWNKTAENLRLMFNAEGGEIGKLEDYRLPQSHNQTLVLKAGPEGWIAEILPALDKSKYIHEDGRRMTDAEIVSFLKESWVTISTGGANQVERTLPAARARRHAEHRALHFKDAESYLKYFEKYGDKDPYSLMISHIGRMSRDIALIREFGPNPDQMVDLFINNIVREEAKSDPKMAKKIEGQAVKTENLYNFVAGRTLPVANEWMARGFDTLRNWMVATRLGSAFISSIPDSATMHLTAAMNNISPLKLARNQLKQLTRSKEDIRLMRRAGLGLDTFTGEINRWGADALGPNFSSKIAGFTVRVSGLNAITEARRKAYGATMYSALGSTVKKYKSLKSLPEFDRKVLESKGVTEDIYQVWRKADLEDWSGDKVLTPDAIYRVDDPLKQQAALKLLEHALEEIDMAVVVPSASERAMMVGGLQKGTLKGELVRSFWLFKGFPISVIHRHWKRALNLPYGTGKAAYLAAFMAGSTILGAFAQQIYEVINGRDPRDMTKGRFWAMAMLKGGSLGVYGDFLFQTNTSYGSTPLAVLSGPVAGYVEDLIGLTQGNAVQAAQGKKTNLGAESVQFIKNNIPHLWYTRAVTDRLIFQNIQEMVSPGYLRRMEKRAKRDYGQEFWWEPGFGLPERGPDLERAIGE